jgi:hypothetical protein
MPNRALGTDTEVSESVEDRRCFVIMPITTPNRLATTYAEDADHFTHVYQLLFVPAIREAGFVPVPPAARGSDLIQAGIVKNLQEADIVLCDVSSLNANVFFELGIRTALNKPIIFVRDSVTLDVPFDAAIMNFHSYDAQLRAWQLPQEIDKLVKHIVEVAQRSDGHNQLWKYFGLTEVAKPPPKVDASELIASPVERKIDDVLREVRDLRSARSRSNDPRRNAGVVLEDGFDLDGDEGEDDLSRTLAEFVKLVDEVAKRRRTQIILSRFGNHLIVDFGKDVYLTQDTDRIRMASLLLEGISVEFLAQV